ncbi:MAG: acetyl-CoA carboxylase biotin carboxyl carrier protein [Polaribacter sp.]
MNIKEIQNLIKFVAKSGASEVKLEMEDVKITIRTGSEKTETTIVQAAPVTGIPQMGTPAIAAQPADAIDNESEDSKFIIIKSPIIGTFYRKPAPDKSNFAEVGTEITVGDTVCVIEAMKLFNEIESEISGKIVKILVDDATPVEFDQPLFLVDPS